MAVVAVMRKLAMALYHVGVGNEEFKPRRLFGRICKQSDNPEGATASNQDQAQSGERTSLRSPRTDAGEDWQGRTDMTVGPAPLRP